MTKKALLIGSVVGALAATSPLMGAMPAFGDDVLDAPNATAPQAGEPAGDDAALPVAPEGSPLTLSEALAPEVGTEAELTAAEASKANALKTVEEYNRLIADYEAQHSDKTFKDLASDEGYMTLILSRHLVKSTGHEWLQKKSAESVDFAAMLTWLLNDYEMLGYMTDNGAPEANENPDKYRLPGTDTWQAALEVLCKVYTPHAADVTDEAGDQAGLNKRMMAATALTHSIKVKQYMELSQAQTLLKKFKWLHESDPLGRYEAFKRMYEHGMLAQEFATENMAELRMVFATPVDNNELQWMNWYYHVKRWGNEDYLTNPKKFGYTQPEFSLPQAVGAMFRYGTYDHFPDGLTTKYYDPENYNMWNEKYHFEEHNDVFDYKVDYGYKDGNKSVWYSPVWMTIDTDGVCWDISYTSFIGYGALGIPSGYIHQPGHASFVSYYVDPQGRTVWGSGYDNYGMKQSGKKTGGLSYLPAGWGDYPWTDFYNMSYAFIGMDAMKDRFNTDYDVAQHLAFIGDYHLDMGDAARALSTYDEALHVQTINLSAWDGVVRAYKALNKTDAEWFDLAKHIGNELVVYPLPMHDLVFNCILPEVGDDPLMRFNLLAELEQMLYKSIDRANTNTDGAVTQPGSNRELANYYLNTRLPKPASFSFNTRALALDKTFAATASAFEYSLDGGNTWSEWKRSEGDASLELTDEQVKSITAEDDILYRAKGSTLSMRIDIAAQNAPVSNSKTNTVNDDEDVVLNVQKGIEYSIDSGDVWAPLTSDVMFEGDREVWIRWSSDGTKLASPHTVLTFTKGEGTAERSYIRAKGGKITVVSTPTAMSSSSADSLIDGRPETEWESNPVSDGWEPNVSGWLPRKTFEFVFKLENPTFISALEYDPATSGNKGNGTILGCELYVSMDGEAWEKAGSVDNWKKDGARKELNLSVPAYGQYVKVKTTKAGTYTFAGQQRGYATVADFRFFENYQVRSAVPERIELDMSEAIKTYKVGDQLDVSGIAATVQFADGTSAILPAGALDWSVDVFSQPGHQTITGSYRGVEVAFEVDVAANDRVATKIVSAEVDSGRVYYAGEAIDKSALKVKVSDGDTSWFLMPGEFEVSGPLVEGPGSYTVSVGEMLQAQVSITAEPAVKAISVAGAEDFTGNYVLGEEFAPESVVVTLTRADDSVHALNPEQYVVQVVEGEGSDEKVFPIEKLSLTRGSKRLRFTLKDHSLSCELPVTVLPYVTDGPFTVEVSDDGKECMLTGYDPEAGYESAIVKIPSHVTVMGERVPVASIGSGAFTSALDLTSVQLPNTVKKVSTGAFTACAKLTRVYMTDYETLAGFTCEKNAFPEVEQGLVFLNPDLGLSESPIPGYKVANVEDSAIGIQIIEPSKRHYVLGEPLDLDGLEVYAILEDGSKAPAVSYDVTGYNKDVSGSQSVEVRLRNTAHSASFDVEVAFPHLTVDTEPLGGAYNSADAIKPLEFGVSAEYDGICYQWYRKDSENAVASPIEGATKASYQPKTEGYYFAEAYIRDANGVEGEHVQSQTVRVNVDERFVAAVGSDGYSSVADAVSQTQGDIVIDLLDDSSISSTISYSGRSVRIAGHGHVLKRGGKHAPAMFKLNDKSGTQSLILDRVLLDGGVEWQGDIDPVLQRGASPSGTIASEAMIVLSQAGSSLQVVNGSSLRNNYNRNSGNNTGGGAIYLDTSASCTIENSSILNCGSASQGGAIWAKYKSINPSQVKLSNVEVSGCSSVQDGGALYVSEFMRLELRESTLRNNRSSARGGSVMVETYAEDPIISNVVIEDSAAKNGGGLASIRSVSLLNVTLSGNQASDNGGAVHASEFKSGNNVINGGGRIEADSGTAISGNSAGISGGGIYAQSAGLSGTTVSANRSGSDGGGVYVSSAATVSDGALVSKNEADGSGGGIFAGSFTTNTSSYTGNSAALDGGAVYAKSIGANLDSFENNVATNGGALYVGTKLSLMSAALDDNDASGLGDGAYMAKGAFADLACSSSQSIFLSTLSKTTKIADLAGGALNLQTDQPVLADTPIAGCLTQSGDLNITLNGGKLKTVGSYLYLADGWMDVAPYRNGETGFTAPQQDGKVFAGWYTTDDPMQMNSKTALPEDIANRRVAYARFVDQNVLGLKFQTNAGVRSDAASVNLRMLSSVADLKLKQVGFEYSIDGGELRPRPTNVVFPTVSAGFSGGADVLKPQDILSPESTRFMAFELRNIPQRAFESTLSATPFWVTFDGTKVMGTTRTQTVRSLVEASSSMYDAGVSHE